MGTASALVLTFLLNAVWQVALLAAVTGLCSLVLRRFSPAQWHALWSTAMLVAVLLPLTSFTLPVAEIRASEEEPAPAGVLDSRPVPVAPSAAVPS